MDIYLTGASGYVGSRLLPRLLEEGHQVTCLMRHPEKYVHRSPFNRCRLVSGDLIDAHSFRESLLGTDAVVHLAVMTPLTIGNRKEEAYWQTNVVGTLNLLKACLHARPSRIVCFSSTAAIGRPSVNLIEEGTPRNPLSAYGRSKNEADKQISSMTAKYGLPTITLCFPHIYGPEDTSDFYRIVKMVKSGILPQVGCHPNLLPMVYISDAVEAIVLALSKGKTGQTYLIADEFSLDTRRLRKIVAANLGLKRKIYPWIPYQGGVFAAVIIEKLFDRLGKRPPVRAENIRSVSAGRQISIEKAKRELGFSPKVSPEEGIRQVIEYYRKNNLI